MAHHSLLIAPAVLSLVCFGNFSTAACPSPSLEELSLQQLWQPRLTDHLDSPLKEILPVLQDSLRGHVHLSSSFSTIDAHLAMLFRVRAFVLFLREDFTKLLHLWTRSVSGSQQPSYISLPSAGIMAVRFPHVLSVAQPYTECLLTPA